MSWRESKLWMNAFNGEWPDAHQVPRRRLESAYLGMRERCAAVAASIATDLPDFTVHDISHLDALWAVGDLIKGDNFDLTPAEAFVFGAAVLTHDLAMTLAAYPGGAEELRRMPGWTQAMYAESRAYLGRPPSSREIANPSVEVTRKTQQRLLREVHGIKAAELSQASWRDSSSTSDYFLLDDAELRVCYGALIGQVAASHWVDIEDLPGNFPTTIGAPVSLPAHWSVDALKVACLLRCADACHIDAGRAPAFLRALRKPVGTAALHWAFQEHLHQPQREADRIFYTTARPFKLDEAQAWWLCRDTLLGIDRELRAVDALLADLGRSRFAVRSVAAVESTDRLVRLIGVDGWTPVDADLRISNVPQVIRQLGGEEMYGHDPLVAVRELVENGADAGRCLRAVYDAATVASTEYRPRVVVSVSDDSAAQWLEVRDNGLGMSTAVLTGALVDFGSSAWTSPEVLGSVPELDPARVEAAGKYGVGFFSVFMLGKRIQVISRRFDAAAADTFVLEFFGGLDQRPILRRASAKEEMLVSGGTRVRVQLQGISPAELFDCHEMDVSCLDKSCRYLFPSLDVDLMVQVGSEPSRLAVEADDWQRISNVELAQRVDPDRDSRAAAEAEYIARCAHRMTELRDEEGRLLGRAALAPAAPAIYGHPDQVDEALGLITVGGAASKAHVNRVLGLFAGRSIKVARDAAVPLVGLSTVQKWMKDQLAALHEHEHELNVNAAQNLAHLILEFGVDPDWLPVGVIGPDRWLNLNEVATWASQRSELVMAQHMNLLLDERRNGPFEWGPNVIATTFTRMAPLDLQTWRDASAWPGLRGRWAQGGDFFHEYCVAGALVVAVANAWQRDPSEFLRVLNDQKPLDLVVAGHRGARSVRSYGIQLKRG